MKEKKYIVYLLIVLLFLFACKDKNSNNEVEIDPFENTADRVVEKDDADVEEDIENTEDLEDKIENTIEDVSKRVVQPNYPDRKIIGHKEAFTTDRVRLFTFRQNFKAILPSDFELGKLENTLTEEVRRKKILDNIAGFFEIFLQQLPKDVSNIEFYQINEDYIHPDSIKIVTSAMNVYIPQRVFPILYYRLGEITYTSDGRYKLNIKIYKENTSLAAAGTGIKHSSVVGEMFFKELEIESKREWLISEINIDFFKLLEPPKKKTEKFLPGAYQKFSWE